MNTAFTTRLMALAFLLVFNFTVLAQHKLKQANADFERLAYPKAVRNYEQFLKADNITKSDKKEALTKLALSYKKLQDFKYAVLTYKELVKNFEGELDKEIYLCYAQVLASNENHREAQKYYSIYGELQKGDIRAQKFTIAYMDKSSFYEDSALYKIKSVESINTRHADFSPMYYEDGLVFVSGRNEGGAIKRIFSQNETPFLDLFQVSNLESEYNATENYQVAQLGGGNKPNLSSEITAFDEPIIEEFSKKINSKYHEGPITFFKDYKKLIFTRNNPRKSKNGTQLLELYISTHKNDKWGNVKALPFNNDEYSCGHPALSPDNRKLYFVSDMPGGFGGTDIYMIDYKDGNWGSPINLGDGVNTKGNELFPYIDELGDLYFSSDGHAGLGGIDIFKMEMQSNIPNAEVKNLGFPINSSKDDFGYISREQGTKGFFSSNRARGFYDDNIYAFEKGCKELKLIIVDETTKLPIANVELRALKNDRNGSSYTSNTAGVVNVCLESGTDFIFKAIKVGYDPQSVSYGTMSSSFKKKQTIKIFLNPSLRPMISGKVISEVNNEPVARATVILTNEADGTEEQVITGIDGRYSFQPMKDGKYSVSAVKENYASNTEKIGEIKKSLQKNNVKRNFGMIAEGDIFRLENIYFDRDKSVVRSDAKDELENRIIPLLKKYPGLQIELRSHTDSRSSELYNQMLSEERAISVYRYLIGKGVNPDQLKARGMGEQELVKDCDDNDDCGESIHKLNRRTEFKILNVNTAFTAKN